MSEAAAVQGRENPLIPVLRKELGRGAGELPALPRAASQALELAQRPEVDFDAVVRLAEVDPPLAARFLGMANSALYFRGVPISSVRTALVRLGSQAVRDVLYMAVYSGTAFKVPIFRELLEESFRHCIVVARSSRRMAMQLDQDPEIAFLAGLLHDVGRARCLKLASRHVRQLAPTDDEVKEALDVLHAEAGAQLVKKWRLPDEVAFCCEYHHEPTNQPMTRIVHAANLLAHYAEPQSPIEAGAVEDAMIRAGLRPADLEQLLVHAVEDFDVVTHHIPLG